MSNPVMPKALQISSLKRIFTQLNPDADSQEVDWEHQLDETLTLPENRLELSITYPQFKWFKDESEEKQTKSQTLEELQDRLSYMISIVPEEAREDFQKMFEDYISRVRYSLDRKLKIAPLKKRIAELEKQVPRRDITPRGPLERYVPVNWIKAWGYWNEVRRYIDYMSPEGRNYIERFLSDWVRNYGTDVKKPLKEVLPASYDLMKMYSEQATRGYLEAQRKEAEAKAAVKLSEKPPEKPVPKAEVEKELPPIDEELGITDEWIEQVQRISPGVKPEVSTTKDYEYDVSLMKYIPEKKDSLPILIIPVKTSEEVEALLQEGEIEGWTWKPEDITRPKEYLSWKAIWEYEYKRADLETQSRKDLDEIAKVKHISAQGTREDVIARILGEEPPKAPPTAGPPTPPPTRPPTTAPTPIKPPPSRGEDTALLRRLQDIFEASMTRAQMSPKRYLPEYRLELDIIKQLATREEMEKAIESFANEIIARERKAPPIKFPIEAPPGLRERRGPLAGMPTDEEIEARVGIPPEERRPVADRYAISFPRKPSGSEIDRFWERYLQDLFNCDMHHEPRVRQWFHKYFGDLTYTSMDAMNEAYRELVEAICAGQEPKIPRKHIVIVPTIPGMGTALTICEGVEWQTSQKWAKTAEELAEAMSRIIGSDVTVTDVKNCLKTAWQENKEAEEKRVYPTPHPSLVILSKEYLEQLIGEKLE